MSRIHRYLINRRLDMKMWVYVVIGFLLIILVQNVGVYTVKGDIEGGEPTGFTEAEAKVDGETLRTRASRPKQPTPSSGSKPSQQPKPSQAARLRPSNRR